jgi:hypothetical protein
MAQIIEQKMSEILIQRWWAIGLDAETMDLAPGAAH